MATLKTKNATITVQTEMGVVKVDVTSTNGTKGLTDYLDATEAKALATILNEEARKATK